MSSEISLPLYLDNNATTPCDPRVVEAMTPYLFQHPGNPASRSHAFGWAAREAVEVAREQVAALIGATAKEIVFTSGATESDNLAIKGAARYNAKKGKHIITVATEHKAILDSCHALEREGFEVTYLEVDAEGLISLDDLRSANYKPMPMMGGGAKEKETYLAALPKHLDNFARLLGEREWFAPSGFSVADLTIYDTLDVAERQVPGTLAKYPTLKAFHARVEARPNVAAWLASEMRAKQFAFPPI